MYTYEQYPGTAFTRSLGDSIAEELGVYALPEITVRKISHKVGKGGGGGVASCPPLAHLLLPFFHLPTCRIGTS